MANLQVISHDAVLGSGCYILTDSTMLGPIFEIMVHFQHSHANPTHLHVYEAPPSRLQAEWHSAKPRLARKAAEIMQIHSHFSLQQALSSLSLLLVTFVIKLPAQNPFQQRFPLNLWWLLLHYSFTVLFHSRGFPEQWLTEIWANDTYFLSSFISKMFILKVLVLCKETRGSPLEAKWDALTSPKRNPHWLPWGSHQTTSPHLSDLSENEHRSLNYWFLPTALKVFKMPFLTPFRSTALQQTRSLLENLRSLST